MLARGHPRKQVALSVGISVGTVGRIARGVYGVSTSAHPCPSKGRPIPSEKKKQMEALFHQGKTTQEISADTGIPKGSVSRILRAECGIGKRPSRRRTRLTVDQMKEVARKYELGFDYKTLADEYGVSVTPIGRAVNTYGSPRRGWAKYRTTTWVDRKNRSFIFKSSWEKAFAVFLDSLNLDWGYEVISYPLKTCSRYTPDFTIYNDDGSIRELVEVHGWLDDPTKARLQEFAEIYPELPFRLCGAEELASRGLIEESWSKHPQAALVTEFKRSVDRGLTSQLM